MSYPIPTAVAAPFGDPAALIEVWWSREHRCFDHQITDISVRFTPEQAEVITRHLHDMVTELEATVPSGI